MIGPVALPDRFETPPKLFVKLEYVYLFCFYYSTSNTIIYSSINNNTNCYYQTINIHCIMYYKI